MLENIKNSFTNFSTNNAFFIDDVFYSYNDVALIASKIKNYIDINIPKNQKLIGLTTYEFADINTYAAIFGILFSGKGVVPINPDNPMNRQKSVVGLADLKNIFISKHDSVVDQLATIDDVQLCDISSLKETEINLVVPSITDEDTVYVLFTSGSTGIPKGVPLSYKNFKSFFDGYFELGYEFTENDRFLQTSDLTFDLSIMSFLAPLLKGACCYTIPSKGVKFTNIYSMLEEHEITTALMVPSVLSYLRPYFEDICLEKMRYSLFCGEALYLDLVKEWSKCVPNALIQNVYGPTEVTIFCLSYNYNPKLADEKSSNGVICIGKPMKHTKSIIVDDNLQIVAKGEKGELCLAGGQLTSGYLKNEERNKNAFFEIEIDSAKERFYKTGDIAYIDDDNDFMYNGRKDYQIKIHGYRIELSEVEHFARELSGCTQVAAIAKGNRVDILAIHLFLENYTEDLSEFKMLLKSKLPYYMMPETIRTIAKFPLNVNGKIDRKTLLNLLTN
ncbi:MAG: AMP-binding protein [Ignavibacteria bacterium]|jgi:amino acid adenylation domain-containing protein|nr:AMP-binding protein [Ignavibacteria bacterium]